MQIRHCQLGGSTANLVCVGVIADTHGLLRPEALDALAGSTIILHAGDIASTRAWTPGSMPNSTQGANRLLDELAAIAPVHAVRGNNDDGTWADQLPDVLMVEFGRITCCVLHDLGDFERLVACADSWPHGKPRVVIAGHSHKPLIERRDGMLFFNPGSAGPRRFTLPVTLGTFALRGDEIVNPIIRRILADPVATKKA